MENVIKGLLKVRWRPQLQFIRSNTKVSVTKPRPPHFEKALVETICLPYFTQKKKPKHIPDFESCTGPLVHKSTFNEDHPYVKIVAEESYNYFHNSKIIVFFHYNNLSSVEKFDAQLSIKKSGMELLFLNKNVLKKALTGTNFETVLSLYEGPTATAFGENIDIQSLIKIDKKLPKLILMGAVVENIFLGLTDIKSYSKFKDITEARLYLVSTLNSASQRLVQQINSHPQNLVGLLNQHKKLLEDGKS